MSCKAKSPRASVGPEWALQCGVPLNEPLVSGLILRHVVLRLLCDARW